MTRPIDEAFVDIRPDVDDFARDLRRGLDRAFAQVRRDASQAADGIENAFEAASRSLTLDMKAGAEAAERAVDDLADNAERDLDRIEREAKDAGRAVAGVFRDAAGRLRADRGRFVAAGRSAGTEFGDALGDGVRRSGFGSVLGDLASSIRNIRVVGPLPLIAGAILAAIPALIALGGLLVDLTGVLALLPAGLAVAAAGIAPLVLAFQGLGDAVKAVVEGDPEKIAEALEGLAPSARTFVGEIRDLLGPLRALGDTVQEAFFRPLRGVLTTVVQALLPALSAGLSTVAAALGGFFAGFGRLAADPRTIAVIAEVFNTTGRIITAAGPVILRFVDALFGTIHEGLPFVERVFAAFNRGLAAFTDLINRAVASGGFDQFVEDAFTALKSLGVLTKSLFDLIIALFGEAGDEGNTFILMLAGLVDGMTAFLQSAEGRAAIQALLDELPALVVRLAGLLKLFGLLFVGVSKFKEAVEAVVAAIVGAVLAIGGFFGRVGEAGRFFTDLPGRIVTAVKALPALVAAVFTDLFDRVTFAVGFGVGTVIRFFIELPGRLLAAVQALPGRLAALFIHVRDTAVGLFRSLVDLVVSFLAGLPGRAASAVSSLPGRVAGILRQMVSDAFRIGQAIINGLVDGITSVVGRAVDAVQRAIRNIVRGAKAALDIGSPSQVFADEVGAQIPAGIAAGIRTGAPGLAAAVDRLTAGLPPQPAAGGGGLSLSGGVTVELHFHAPVSEQDARAAGTAAADGLMSRLSSTFLRRDVRLAVRTL